MKFFCIICLITRGIVYDNFLYVDGVEKTLSMIVCSDIAIQYYEKCKEAIEQNRKKDASANDKKEFDNFIKLLSVLDIFYFIFSLDMYFLVEM